MRTSSPIRVVKAASTHDFMQGRHLIEDYAKSLGIDLEFQRFSSELTNLSTEYGPPSGCLVLAYAHDALVGCAALREIDKGTCEMKRLYVKPEMRGRSVGRKLANAIIEEARGRGYQRIWLDTLSTMTEAQKLYRSLGFQKIAPYRHNPIEGTSFLGLTLDR